MPSSFIPKSSHAALTCFDALSYGSG